MAAIFLAAMCAFRSVDMEIYQDKGRTAEERASDLLGRMSIGEKMGQVVCFWPRLQDSDESVFNDQYPYGAGALSLTYTRMLKTRGEAVSFQRKWQALVMENSPHRIPAICHLEGIVGAYIQGAVSFPTPLGRAASFDMDLERRIGEIVGREESSLGVSHVFAPVLDVSRDPRNGRMAETYGEDPTLISAMGTSYCRGITSDHGTEQGVEAVAKHFCGFHGSSGGVQSSSFEVSGRTLREVYAKPFQACIAKGVLRGVMPCYTPINLEGTSASEKLLTDLLRNEMGFDGLVVSDYTGIAKLHERNRLYDSLEEAGFRSLASGMDFETPFKKALSDELKRQFESGERDISVLDSAVYRILVEKFRMGLFEHPFAMEETNNLFYNAEDSEISRKSALESIVLVKNNGILPIRDFNCNILVVGCHASSARYYFGGYTHYSTAEGNHAMQHEKEKISAGLVPETYPGSPILRSDEPDYETLLKHQKPECRNLLEELEARYPESRITYAYGYDCIGTDESHFADVLEKARKADLVILTLGGKYGTRKIATMGEGSDSTNINLPPAQEKFIRLLSSLGKPAVGVHLDGRPVSSDAAEECLDAVVEAWSPSEFGSSAIVDVLSGRYNPCGKFPVSVAYNSGQIPVYYNTPNGSSFTPYTSIGVFGAYVDCPHEPRYPFGYGLSYTSFGYSGLILRKERNCVRVTFSVTNTGDFAGTEIVQVYARDEYASVLRPVRELVGFGRVTLEVGQTRVVSLMMDYSQLSFFDGNRNFKVEKGWFTIEVGSSSTDIRLEDRFCLSEDLVIEGRNRSFWAEIES